MITGDAWLDGEYRYSLTRTGWSTGEGKLLISMLNPSTADAEKNDPTLVRCIYFARMWGFASLEVVNPFALISSSPKDLFIHSDPIGPKCDQAISDALASADAYWLAGGNPPSKALEPRILQVQQWFMARAQYRKTRVFCVGCTKEGWPKHPLARGAHRVPDTQLPIPFLEQGRAWR